MLRGSAPVYYALLSGRGVSKNFQPIGTTNTKPIPLLLKEVMKDVLEAAREIGDIARKAENQVALTASNG
jgi:hypothetical protein